MRRARPHLERHRGERNGHRIVRVHDFRTDVVEDPHELPGRVHVELAPRREAEKPESFARTPPQLAALMCDEHRRMPERLEPGDGEQDLILSAAPRACGVYMKRLDHR